MDDINTTFVVIGQQQTFFAGQQHVLLNRFMNFGGRLKAERLARGLSQVDLAELAGMPARNGQQTIQKLEERDSERSKWAPALCKALNLTLTYALEGGDPKYTPDNLAAPPDSGEYDFVTRVTDANLSAGSGAILWDFDEIENSHSFRREWMQQHRLRADKCKVWSVVGPSMEPTVNGGDVVLINMADREPKHGKVFALVCEDGLRLKRLVKNDQGRWIMRSDNADKRVYPDEPITDDGCAIIGVAVWRGGGVL